MIIKGNRHNNGVRLAQYMLKVKGGERAELVELRGFSTPDVLEALRSVDAMAQGTKSTHPFFHVQVRNHNDDRLLTRAEWLRIADRIETTIGYAGQPRAIAFHIDEQTGNEHMHIAFSLIDDMTRKAKPLPFYKERLKSLARELEQELGLTPVTNERATDQPRAAKRNEAEQARRLGVDSTALRQTIRTAYEHSDNGQSLQAALAEEGLTLARGDRRAYVVIDHAGGVHALNGRLLDQTTKQVAARLADLDLESLPSVQAVRAQQTERQPKAVQKQAKPTDKMRGGYRPAPLVLRPLPDHSTSRRLRSRYHILPQYQPRPPPDTTTAAINRQARAEAHRITRATHANRQRQQREQWRQEADALSRHRGQHMSHTEAIRQAQAGLRAEQKAGNRAGVQAWLRLLRQLHGNQQHG